VDVMGWREKMKSETPTQNPQNPQNLSGAGGFESIESIEHRDENEKGYPIPTTERGFAIDERKAIIDADGGQDKQIPYIGPVDVVMQSAILGAAVDVILEPDQAAVDGVVYSNAELVDLLSRGISADDLQTIHEVKKQFNGEVIK
jgi:hypothetical protein